jgi:type 1 glutamine amidotransferase
MNQVLLITDGIFHPPLLGRLILHRTLKKMPGYRFEQIRSLEQAPENLDPYSAMVVYFHHKKIAKNAVDAFERYVSGGGGVLAIHSATASAKENRRFTNVLGGRFVGHGPVEPFVVSPASPESEIFSGISAFEVTDERYLHETQPDIETHFTTEHEGELVPIVWTRTHGKGRVCYACPGHKAASLRIPAYQEILRRGLDWVCARDR